MSKTLDARIADAVTAIDTFIAGYGERDMYGATAGLADARAVLTDARAALQQPAPKQAAPKAPEPAPPAAPAPPEPVPPPAPAPVTPRAPVRGRGQAGG